MGLYTTQNAHDKPSTTLITIIYQTDVYHRITLLSFNIKIKWECFYASRKDSTINFSVFMPKTIKQLFTTNYNS